MIEKMLSVSENVYRPCVSAIGYFRQKRTSMRPCEFNGAQGRNRTGTVFPPRDFKSLASTYFATWASRHKSGFIWRRNPESNRDTRICNPLHSHSAIPPCLCLVCQSRPGGRPFFIQVFPPAVKTKKPCRAGFLQEIGAGNEIRTRDPNLGKVVLYQLSYSRVLEADGYSSRGGGCVKNYVELQVDVRPGQPDSATFWLLTGG